MAIVHFIPVLIFGCFVTLAFTQSDTSSNASQDSVIILDLKKDVSIPCNLSFTPEATIDWWKGNAPLNTSDSRVRVENGTLKISNAQDSDAGTYVCGIKSLLNQTIILKTRARVEKFKKPNNFVQGGKLNLQCTVYGYPTPSIVWYKDSTPVKELNKTDHIKLAPNSDNVTDGSLTIDELDHDDRGNYRCEVTNDVNNVSTEIMIRVKDKLAALWPFLGILAEVAVLCTIIFIYEKRRAKQEYEESDTDQNNESKPVSDPKDKDVRQRK